MHAELILIKEKQVVKQQLDKTAVFLNHLLTKRGYTIYHQSMIKNEPSCLLKSIQRAHTRSEFIVICGTAKSLHAVIQWLKKSCKTKSKELSDQLKKDSSLVYGNSIFFDQRHYWFVPSSCCELKEQEAYLFFETCLNQQAFTTEPMHFYGLSKVQLERVVNEVSYQTCKTRLPFKIKEKDSSLHLTFLKENMKENTFSIMKKEIAKKVGACYYGTGDEVTLEQAVVFALSKKKFTLSASESLTAGLFQATLGNVPGVSKVFPGGFVTYSLKAKEIVLGVKKETIATFGVVSEQVAKEMADQTNKKMNTDYALGFTGVAGPDQLEGKKAGTVCIGLAKKEGKTETFTYHFEHNRVHIRQHAVKQGLFLLWQQLYTKGEY